MLRNTASKQLKIYATRAFTILALVIFASVQFASPASADGLTQDDVNAIYQWPLWAPNACAAGGGGSTGGTTQTASDSTDIANSANAKTAFVFLTSSTNGLVAFSAAQAAGIVGNLWIESSLSPTAVNTQAGIHYGIAQWGGGRLDGPQGMKAWVTADGEDPNTSLPGQLKFIIQELKTTETNTKAAILKDTTPAAAADDWNTLYEVSGTDPTNREKAANSVFQAFQSLAGTASTIVASSGGGCTSTSTSPNCIGDTGNAKILCSAKKYQGIYYLFGGAHAGRTAFVTACTPAALAGATDSKSPYYSTTANPGPCATDCSGLVSMAVDDAFGQTFDWSVSEGDGTMQGSGAEFWKEVPLTQVQPGDIVTMHTGNDGHVEIVDHYDGTTLYTFGSHYTGVTTGPTTAGLSYYSRAFRWSGPTAGA